MAVLKIEEYRQKNGEDILKVILKPTKVHPNGFFYCDSWDEELVRGYSWGLLNKKQPYVRVGIENSLGRYDFIFHREKAFSILSYYPDYLNHIDGVKFDNIDKNLDVVSNQQNMWARPSKGYHKVRACHSFQSQVTVNRQLKYTTCVKSEVEACQLAYLLEIQYEDYLYDFLKDRCKDLDLLDLERIGQISEEEAVYRHVCRYALDNAWYYYRYNLTDYFRDNKLPIPAYSLDSEGYMTHPVTGQRLCPW